MVVATAGLVAAQSATKEDGLVNQAFKITILIGLALAIGVGLYLIYNLTGLLQDVADVVTGKSGPLSGLRFGIELVTAPITGLLSALFGRSGK